MNETIDVDVLLPQIVSEKEVDIALLSEQYKNQKILLWLMDDESRAAIWILRQDKILIDASEENGFVWMRNKSITYVSYSLRTLL